MRKVFLLLVFTLSFFPVISQEILERRSDSIAVSDSLPGSLDQREYYLSGRIISIEDKKPLQSAHVVNMNSVEGTVTEFFFSICYS